MDSTTTAKAQAEADAVVAPRVSVPPAGQDTPARRAAPDAVDAADPGDRWLVAAIAVAAILAATLLGLLVRRNRRPTEGTVVSLAQPLWVAGVSSDRAVGAFAGTAAALHVSPPTGSDTEPAVRYCVLNDAGGAPVWVSPQDIRESRSLDERQRRRAADALAEHPAAARAARFTRPGARSRRAGPGPRRRPAGASRVERRVTWFRSLGMPPQAIADLLADEEIPPPHGHDTWTPAAVAQIDGGDGEHHTPATAGPPTKTPGTTETDGRPD